jgi:DNA processing protein
VSGFRACERCVARAWLLGRLAGNLDRVRTRIWELLCLEDEQLIAAVGGRRREQIALELAVLDAVAYRERAAAAGLELICRHDERYPYGLGALAAPPAVLHVSGGVERLTELAGQEPVAIVGARNASAYGLELAGALARGVGSAGVTVVSGMARGADAAAHVAALDAGAGTIAVMPGGADRPYPPGAAPLYRRITANGVAISELPPGTQPRRWTFRARNRTIAALAAMTVVVEAGERSGSLVTAHVAAELGRPVGAVPGRVTASLATGPNGLIARGATLVQSPQDVLDALFGCGIREAADPRGIGGLPDELQRLLAAIGDGHETPDALQRAGLAANDGLAALAALELGGFIVRAAGGRFAVVP